MSVWSNSEVQLIVSDYFDMLADEIAGKPVNKAQHRRALLPLLNKRSEGSVEFKHQNISAVLINLGQPYLKGYLPRFNYQIILEEFVIDYLLRNQHYVKYFQEFSTAIPVSINSNFQESIFIVNAPNLKTAKEPRISYRRNPIKVNYLWKEQMNTILGKSGEELAVKFEKWKLLSIGKDKLANKVEWISQTEGEGAGFDILSRNPDGTDKYIEVKTTKLGKETPFYFSRNELEFSIDHKEDYHLYRLFDFSEQPRMFAKQGDFSTICHSTPTMYKGFF